MLAHVGEQAVVQPGERMHLDRELVLAHDRALVDRADHVLLDMLARARIDGELARVDIAPAGGDELRSAALQRERFHDSRLRGRAIPYSSSRLISVRREIPSNSAARV